MRQNFLSVIALVFAVVSGSANAGIIRMQVGEDFTFATCAKRTCSELAFQVVFDNDELNPFASQLFPGVQAFLNVFEEAPGNAFTHLPAVDAYCPPQSNRPEVLCAYDATVTTGSSEPIQVPEPSSLGLLGAGLVALGILTRKRRSART